MSEQEVINREPTSSSGVNISVQVQDSSAKLLPKEEGENTENKAKDLGYLNNVSEIKIKQCINLREQSRGTEEPNVYIIVDAASGEKLYTVQEDEKVCTQQICGANRPFKMRIYDKFKRELILIERPQVSCDYFCGITNCCDYVNVYVKNYKTMRFDWVKVGQVRQYWCPLFPYFSIRDADGDEQLTVRGPLITSGCFGTARFPIKDNSRQVGEILKEWSGVCVEYTSDKDLFSIKFPPRIDEKLKASLIGALFLIDFKFYEVCCRAFCG